MPPSAIDTRLEGEYYHVHFREPDVFDKIRTPKWAAKVSDAISKGSEVRMGHTGDEWVVESVLVKKNMSAEKAREQAEKIIAKIEGE